MVTIMNMTADFFKVNLRPRFQAWGEGVNLFVFRKGGIMIIIIFYLKLLSSLKQMFKGQKVNLIYNKKRISYKEWERTRECSILGFFWLFKNIANEPHLCQLLSLYNLFLVGLTSLIFLLWKTAV